MHIDSAPATASSLTGLDVPRPLSHFGTGRRDILPATVASADTASVVTIASVSDQDWHISRTHGVYQIPACKKGEPYAVLAVASRSDAIDLGDNRRLPFQITAREIAEDLLQDLQDHGVFICAGAQPGAEELRAATERRDAYYHRLIGEGDTLWARGHSFREISDMHRRAAMALGVEREWAYVPLRMSDCPACGERVKSGVAVCKHCGGILDEEKAAAHGLGPRAMADAQSNLTQANGEKPAVAKESAPRTNSGR